MRRGRRKVGGGTDFGERFVGVGNIRDTIHGMNTLVLLQSVFLPSTPRLLIIQDRRVYRIRSHMAAIHQWFIVAIANRKKLTGVTADVAAFDNGQSQRAGPRS